MKEIGAYLIKDKTNNKFYTGSSEDLEKRIDRHVSDLKHNAHKNKNLQERYNSNPELGFYEQFSFIKIHADTKEKAIELEQKILDIHKDDGVLYNIAIDAKHSSKGLIKSQEFKDKISLAQIGLKRTPEQNERNRIAQTGKKASEETIIKMRESMIGKNLGKTHTQKTKDLLREKHTGKKLSEETKAKIGQFGANFDYDEDWHKKQKTALTDKIGKKLIADGICYRTLTDAAAVHNLTTGSVSDRVNSTTGKFDGWVWI